MFGEHYEVTEVMRKAVDNPNVDMETMQKWIIDEESIQTRNKMAKEKVFDPKK